MPMAATFSAAMLLALPWIGRRDTRHLPVAAALLGLAVLAKGLVRAGPGGAPMSALPERARPGPAARGGAVPGGGAAVVPALLPPQWEGFSARFLRGA